MKSIGAIIAALTASMGFTPTNILMPKFFRSGTGMRRVREEGDVGAAGDKLARHVFEGRIGVNHPPAYPLKATPRMIRAFKKKALATT